MDLEEYRVMFQVEETLWWYSGMQAITRAVIERYYPRGAGLRILDTGCGTCGALSYLSDYGTAIGLDLSHFALELSRTRARPIVVCSSCTAIPFPAESFDLVTFIDLLPMLQQTDDENALREAVRMLVPGGRLFIRAAAYNWLRGTHDRVWNVQYRYTLGELADKARRAGLVIEHSSYANMWLLPIAIVKRSLERFFSFHSGSDLTVDVGPLNGVLKTVLASEASWVAKHRLPFGLSIIIMARKP